jgi:DNA ligase-1
MRAFAALFAALDASTRTSRKVAALADYFRVAKAPDAAWAVYFLIGERPRQAVPSRLFREVATQAAGLAPWLFDECYAAVGDLAETIALLLPPPGEPSDLPLSVWIEERLLTLRNAPPQVQRDNLQQWWQALTPGERLVFNKLITGAFRVGVSRRLVVRALAEASGIPVSALAHRLAGEWVPTPESYRALVAPVGADCTSTPSQPYPFFLAHALEGAPQALGPVEDWQIEWKWDGIRAQLIRRNGEVFLWSRGDELISAQFPEIVAGAARLPDCVLDGELVVAKGFAVQPFAQLQTRLGRKSPGRKVLAESPALLIAYDLLEHAGEDWRQRPLHERRKALAGLIFGIAWAPGEAIVFDVSPTLHAPTWEIVAVARADCRRVHAEGLMLKRRAAPYGIGRTRGDWWKWKIEPYTLDAVLMYAQRGHGKRAGLYTDYTFGLWRGTAAGGRELVPFAKAYSGLTDAQIRAVDAFVRKHTEEKFGPVRTVTPQLVFELAFEGIQASRRHKSGIAVRFPRMHRIRHDKRADEADTVESAMRLMGEGGADPS